MIFLQFKANLLNNLLLQLKPQLLLIQTMKVMMRILMINLLMTLVTIVKNKIQPNLCKKLNRVNKIKRMYLQLFKSLQLKLIPTQNQPISHLKSRLINLLRSHKKTKTRVNHNKIKIKSRMVVQSLSSNSNSLKVTMIRRTKRREIRRTSTKNEVYLYDLNLIKLNSLKCQSFLYLILTIKVKFNFKSTDLI